MAIQEIPKATAAELGIAPCEPRVPARLQEMFARLDVYEDRVPLAALDRALRELVIDCQDLRDLCVFDNRCYCRNLLHEGPSYQALLLCWKDGQGSPIHDHSGSSCAFRVLDGCATERIYQPLAGAAPGAPPLVKVKSSRQLETGFICANDEADIHAVENCCGGDLVTLHIYSPALLYMATYEVQ